MQKIAGVKERSNTASLLFSHFNPINDLCNHHILFFQNLIIISMNTWYLLSVVQTPPWPPSPHYHSLQPRPVSPTSGWGHQGRQHHPQIRTRIINRTAGPPPLPLFYLPHSSLTFLLPWPHLQTSSTMLYSQSVGMNNPEYKKSSMKQENTNQNFSLALNQFKKKQVRRTQRCNWFV